MSKPWKQKINRLIEMEDKIYNKNWELKLNKKKNYAGNNEHNWTEFHYTKRLENIITKSKSSLKKYHNNRDFKVKRIWNKKNTFFKKQNRKSKNEIDFITQKHYNG